MGLRAGWLALFVFVWLIGAFLGSTFEYQSSDNGQGISYSTGTATFTFGSYNVTGIGTTWDNATMAGGNIKADTDAIWTKIQSINNATQVITLYSPYTGAGGAGLAYTMAQSPGWSGSGSGGYSESAPATKLEFIINLKNAIHRGDETGTFSLPSFNTDYFKAIGEVILWKWSFMEDYQMFYWIFCVPFVSMGILSLAFIFIGTIRGNLTWN